MKHSRARSLAALFSLAVLAGCSSESPATTAKNGQGEAQDAAPPKSRTALYCPQVAMLQQARTMTVFLPGRSDIAGQLTTAQITGFTGDCVLEKDKHALLLHIQPSFLADNGPANQGRPLTLTWFTAITKGDAILAKADYQVTLKFDGNATTTAATGKTVKIEVPDVPDSAQLQILLGFEMTPDQLAYATAHPDAAP
jgi:hypothetical protein